MNLHLIADSAFSQYFIDTLERLVIRDNNKIVCYSRNKTPRWTKGHDSFLNLENQHPGWILDDYPGFDDLYIHFFDPKLYNWINKDHRIKSFYWCIWGADIYNRPFLDFKLYLPETNQFINKNFTHTLRKQYQKLFVKPKFLGALNKLKGVLTWVDEEAEYIQSVVDHKIEHLPFIYGKVTGSLQADKKPDRSSESNYPLNIMVGHNATPSGNHIDFFEKIAKQIDPKKFSFFLPVSYGSSEYRSFLKSKCARYDFLINFLDDFMPFDEYLGLLREMDYFVMNSLRPIGMGNFFMAILLHKPIFIQKTNLVNSTLDRMEIQTFPIEEFHRIEKEDLYKHIDNQQNIQNLLACFNISAIERHYINIFS